VTALVHTPRVAGFSSESWPASNRNPGRHQIGIPGRIASESAGGLRRRPTMNETGNDMPYQNAPKMTPNEKIRSGSFGLRTNQPPYPRKSVRVTPNGFLGSGWFGDWSAGEVRVSHVLQG
jgi:hypothetical protein